ncbi:MAG: FAD-dependent monooxygenase [Acidobacteriia bacterium]|nr:FAD-dependent monooxygenase [Terriglobia bacterium]
MPGQYDLIIVGGGLGGSALAKCMAEHGARVLVLERDQQFKDRVRGEFVTPWGVAEANKLGIGGLLRERVAHQVPWVDFHSETFLMAHRDAVATTPHRLPCFAFYHPSMQEVLLDAAAKAGAHVRRGVSVKDVQAGAPATVVAGENGGAEKFQARLVVAADGRSSAVRASAGFKVQRDPEDMLVAGVLLDGMKAAEDTGQIVINSRLGQVAVVFPQGRGRARAYLCYHTGTQPRHQGATDVPRFIEDCKKTGVNAGLYAGAKPAGPLATFDGAEVWVEHPYRDGVALIGDAAAASDPTWGQGLSLTLRDARVLRDHLLATEDWNAAGHAYAREHDYHADVIHKTNQWYTQLYLETGPEAVARRTRALPLIAQDPTRQPDGLFAGPDVPVDDTTRRRFFGEA